MVIYNNSNINPQTLKNLTVTSFKFDKMICKDKKIYISFLDKIMIFTMDALLTSVSTIIFTSTVAMKEQLDFNVREDLLTYSTN